MSPFTKQVKLAIWNTRLARRIMVTLELDILVNLLGATLATTKTFVTGQSSESFLLVEAVVKHCAVLVADAGQAATSDEERKACGSSVIIGSMIRLLVSA